MSLTILNNVASLTAENSLAQTSANLQKTLQQLSTGLKINSGADDAAGLSITSGLQANIAALVQSQNNANNGIGFLQVADGALSQVTGLLNRAVTLATEASSSGVTGQQLGSANAEYQSILSEINQIGANTQFNGTQVFTDGNTSPVMLANGGSTVTGTINPADTLSGGMTLTSTIPGDLGATAGVTTSDSGGTSTTATITPGATLSGGITITSTVPGTSASTSDVSLTDNDDGTISGSVAHADTLSGNLVITSTTAGTSGSTTGIVLSNNGASQIVANVNSADTLSGGFTVTSTAPSVGTAINPITFNVTGSGTSQAITSSVITTGATLSGSLVINSTGSFMHPGSATLNLANYQGLSSSNADTATAAAYKLALDLTTALWSKSDTNYSATISGGVLSIQSPNPGDSQSMDIVGSGNTLTSAVSLVTGDTLGGSLNVQVGGRGFAAQFSDYQGLTSSNAATVTAALTKLGQGLTSFFGDTYTASINSSGKLVIQSSNAGTNVIDLGSETETPAGDPAGEELSVGSGYVQQTYSLAPVTTPATFDLSTATGANLQSKLQTALGANYTVAYSSGSGALSITVSSDGALAGITSIACSNNSAQETSGATSPSVTSTSINVAGQTGSSLATYLGSQLGSGYSVSNDGGGGFTVSVLSGGTTIAAGSGTATETAAAVPPAISSKVVSLTGVSTANLQSTLQGTLGSDYAVSYDQSSGDLAILLNSGNGEGITSFTSSSTLTQNTGSTPDVNTPSTINLTGVAPTNLASSLVSQLGSAAGNYDVSYNTSSGALNIGLSSAGTAAGIASISANMSSLVETVAAGTTGLSAFNVFTSDGTGSGTSIDVTVGSLSSANVGASNGHAGVDLSASNLLSQSTAASTLTMITAAVNGISSQRGAVGANINRLVATASVEGTTVVNLTSAMNSIQNADIGKTVANMTQYNVLQSTGMAALQQANQAQQAVLKLVQ